jgi:hypothetical protein
VGRRGFCTEWLGGVGWLGGWRHLAWMPSRSSLPKHAAVQPTFANDRWTAAVPEVARRQGGVFTAAQARAEGWTDRTIRRRIEARRWVHVAGRGLAEPTDRWTAFQLAMAAQLTLPKAVISHRTAAALHGFPGLGDHEQTCDVILTARGRGGRGIKAHLLRLDPKEMQIRASGLRITSASRTALDCLALLPIAAALDLWAWVSTRGILDQAQLRNAIAARRNWYGTARLRLLGDLVATGAVSGAEYLFHQLLLQAQVTGWSANVPLVDDEGLIGVADVVFPTHKVIIEIDGYRAHSSRSSFISDRRRQNRLMMAGYTVLRFTWDDLTHRPTEVIKEVQRVLAAK